jgi:putative hydrolase of the HAD superfamily
VLIHVAVKKPMVGYADLKELAAIAADRFLVTSGFRKLQESKIRALGFSSLFRGIVVDAIDDVERKGKRSYFQEIIDTYKYVPSEVLVVGDNPESEIEAGNSLGLRTVQILRPGIVHSPKATHHIRDLTEVGPLL